MAYRERQRRRRRNYGDGSLTKTILAVIVLVGFVGSLVAFLYAGNKAEDKLADINQQTYCQKSTLPDKTVILIDHTDRINPTQRAALEERLWDVADGVAVNGAIKLFSVDKINTKVLSPEIDMCNPGSEKEVSEWTGNKRLAKKRYEEKFKEPLHKLLNSVFDEPGAHQSPIMEAVQSVVVTSFIGNGNDSKHKKLILVSDLLEYTDDFSLYKGIPDFKSYKKGPHWPKVKADMSDVDVEIFFLHRAGEEKLQTSALRDFWVDYLEAQGASVTRFVPIEG